MSVRLIVKWEGDVPGIREGRLSLNTFGPALTKLRSSLRRIATNIVNEALREKEATSGRLTKAASQLDIQLMDLVKTSVGFESVVTISPPPGHAFSLFEDLPANASVRLLEAIEAERQGTLTNASVRQYLALLPSGITRQTYSVYNNDTALREVSFGEMTLAAVPLDLPYIAEYMGDIVGVGFEPGQTEVRVKTNTTIVTLTATPEQVEIALKLRSSHVRSLAVVQGSLRKLLWLQGSNAPINRSTREAAIFERWGGLLARLAK